MDFEVADLLPMVATDAVNRINIGDNDDWKADDFGWYTYINIKQGKTANELPVLAISWVRSEDDAPGKPIALGTARALYKALAEFGLAADHLAYIAYELGRAEVCALNNLPYEQT